MNKLELVIIPTPLKGHLVSTIELATQLLSREERFSATILLIQPPLESDPKSSFSHSLASSHSHIDFIKVPSPENLPPPELLSESVEKYFGDYLASHNSTIRNLLRNRFGSRNNPAVVIVDMFWSAMIGVAEELGIPSYVFFTSGAAFLGLMLFLHTRLLLNGSPLEETDPGSLEIPSYKNPVPIKFCPNFMFCRNGSWESLAGHAGEFRRAKGIIVNSFQELEPHAVESLSAESVYTVGPLLDLSVGHGEEDQEIMRWLNGQPEKSVVFLCFGSMGTFGVPQLKEIAAGLDRSGHRFLWSVRVDNTTAESESTEEFLSSLMKVESSLTEKGKIVAGWVPQTAVLGHVAIGGFVSHCGWNSVLESVWFGVPVVTWPLYAEQHMNAFEMVTELGVAVGLRMDYRKTRGDVVLADEVEEAVRRVMMDGGDAVRERASVTREKCRKAVEEGGSSFVSMGRLVKDVLGNACAIKCVDERVHFDK